MRTTSLAAAQAVAYVLAHLFEVELLYEAFEFLLLVVARQVRHFQHAGYVVLYAHLAEHAGLLCQIADAATSALIDRQIGYLLVAQIDVSSIGQDEAGGHVERSRLASTVRTQQSDNLALTHVEGDVVHHCSLAVYLDQAFAAKL